MADDPRWRRFLTTTAATAFLLVILGGGAVILRNDLHASWHDYTAIASVILGVGGVFVLASIATDGAQEDANAVGLGAVGFGGILLAYKELMSASSPDAPNTDEPNLAAFAILVTAVFIIMIVLLALAVFISSSPENPYKLPIIGIVVGAVGISVGKSVDADLLILLAWLLLLFSAVRILFMAHCTARN